jgi:glycosyltransferase involved in cell wall biosynthesis
MMPDSRTITVVIPAYNAAAFIEEALDSVARQTRQQLEIVVVDDGSQDDTTTRVKNWKKQHDLPVTLIRQENKGLPAARNAGINAATGQFIALLDADDLFVPETLVKLVQGFKAAPDLGLVFGKIENFDAQKTAYPDFFSGSRLFEIPYRHGPNGLRIMQESAFSKIIFGNFVPCCCCLFRKEDAVAIGFFDESLRNNEDRDFFSRLSKHVTIAYYDEVLARRRIHRNSISGGRNNARTAYYCHKMLVKLTRMTEELQLSEVEKQALASAHAQAVKIYLYNASEINLARYLYAVREVRAQFNPHQRIRIRALAKAALHSVLGSAQRDFLN